MQTAKYGAIPTVYWQLVEPLTRRLQLRRYHSEAWDKANNRAPVCCPGKLGFHNAQKFLRDEQFAWVTRDDDRQTYPSTLEEASKIPDESYPLKCDECDYLFVPGDSKLIMQELLFTNPKTGELRAMRDLGPGAVYYDPFDGQYYGGTGAFGPGPDGKYLIAICPDGSHWNVDSRASNCTMKEDNNHKCWVRHGSPKDGTLHVDKNGKTCQAGGGSIATGDYHGFLHHGMFTASV